jgi:hypothetical protein
MKDYNSDMILKSLREENKSLKEALNKLKNDYGYALDAYSKVVVENLKLRQENEKNRFDEVNYHLDRL